MLTRHAEVAPLRVDLDTYVFPKLRFYAFGNNTAHKDFDASTAGANLAVAIKAHDPAPRPTSDTPRFRIAASVEINASKGVVSSEDEADAVVTGTCCIGSLK